MKSLSTFNAHIAMGNVTRQTNGLPDGGKTFNWAKSVNSRSTGRRDRKEKNTGR